MGQIIIRNQKPKYCNLVAITTGSKKDYILPSGEIWLVDTTNSSKTNGSGKYDKYIIGDDNHTASYLAANALMDIDNTQQIEIDSVPTSGSNNAVSSGGVYQAIQNIDVTSQISGKADKTALKPVAFSGSYNDLENTPTIPSEVTESTVNDWGFTKNTGTITGITMNGASKGISGIVDLGTVITDISGKVDSEDVYTKLQIDEMLNNCMFVGDIIDNI